MNRPRVVWLLLALLVISVPLTAQQTARDPRYPAHWFTPVNDPKKPVWEILPQEAGPGEVILSKRKCVYDDLKAPVFGKAKTPNWLHIINMS